MNKGIKVTLLTSYKTGAFSIIDANTIFIVDDIFDLPEWLIPEVERKSQSIKVEEIFLPSKFESQSHLSEDKEGRNDRLAADARLAEEAKLAADDRLAEEAKSFEFKGAGSGYVEPTGSAEFDGSEFVDGGDEKLSESLEGKEDSLDSDNTGNSKDDSPPKIKLRKNKS